MKNYIIKSGNYRDNTSNLQLAMMFAREHTNFLHKNCGNNPEETTTAVYSEDKPNSYLVAYFYDCEGRLRLDAPVFLTPELFLGDDLPF